MNEKKLVMIGCGTVGQGLLEIIEDKTPNIKLIAISDKLKGSLLDPKGIDIPYMLGILDNDGKVDDYDKASDKAITGLDAIETIKKSNGDIMAEMTYTDIETGEPATSHIKAALKQGMHVTTSNKGPAALYYTKLQKLASDNGVKLFIEGTVMSGTPIFNLARECFAGSKITEVSGILNGTTNYILSKMENEGWDYKDALKKAQELGYAEADPTADVEGHDALAKVVILSNCILGGNIKPEDVPCEGINNITLEDVNEAAENGMRYKLLGSTKIEEDKITASVKPVKLELSNPLAGVGGATNALTFKTDLLGEVTIQGPGAGKIETGYSIFVDIMSILNHE
ncbi:MAG: homoserine dehydrogenase [Candidatus Cloacimonetes bacterium]|nr:homoserine dehydrogenase [Candidatus Cloacimonadota bacterium]